MKTGEHLKIKRMGEKVLGVELEGNPNKPEPEHFRVCFPGGDIEVVRTTVNDYWVHVRVNHEDHGSFCKGEDIPGQIVDARLDLTNKHASEVNLGDFNDPQLYHVAFRVGVREVEK
jgi:hypothetical protein